MHLAELLHEAETSEKLGINGLLNWFIERRADAEAFKGNESYLIRLERDEEAVKIVTVHKSKGLEFPIVFCPFAAHSRSRSNEKDFIYHDDKLNRLIHFDKDESGDKYKRTKREDFAEMMRLFYVAVTRAKNLTYLYWGNIRSSDYSALGYLFYAPSKTAPCPDSMSSEFDEYFEKMKATPSNRSTFPPAILARIEKNLKFKVDYPEPQEHPYSYVPENTELDPSERILNGRIDTKWRVSSFSNITKYSHEIDFSGRYEDEDDSESIKTVPKIAQEKPKHFAHPFWKLVPENTLPTDLGNCVHEMFEVIDFKSGDAAIRKKILPILNSYFRGSRELSESGTRKELSDLFVDSAVSMIRSVLSEKLALPAESVYLQDIAMGDMTSEMEFYYPFSDFSSADVADAFSKHSSNEMIRTEFPALLKEGCDFYKIKGFMNGKMDLVFKLKEKYYILDWKTNFVPNSYSPENITRKMIDNYYVLQYGIYVKALDKLLKKELKNYDYDRDFGGVIYLFLRGIGGRKEGEKQTGVYFDKPDKRIIEAL